MALCRDYVVRGRPVSSRQLHEAHGLAWSTATIRNELKELEEAGYVQKPHSAAGRVPTRAGLRCYVDSLSSETQGVRLDQAVHRVFAAGLSGQGDASSRLNSTTRLLSEISGCVAIGFFGQAQSPVLRSVELLPVAPGRALLVTTTREGSRRLRRIDVDTELVRDADELERVAAQLDALVVGRTLAEAREQLSALVREREAQLDQLLAYAVRLGWLVCSGLGLDPLWLEVAGQPSLTHAVEGQEGALAQTLAALEDYQRLAHLLCQLLPEGEAAPSVRVGLGPGLELAWAEGSKAGVAAPFSLVGCRVEPASARALSGAETGVVALLGPSRMDYARLIPLVEYAARAVAERG